MGSKIEWRTCGACSEHYKGKFGECPKCQSSHEKASKCRPEVIGFSKHKGSPTLDVQEGNSEEYF